MRLLSRGITGNFDDAQTGVKKMFSDEKLASYMDEKGYQFPVHLQILQVLPFLYHRK